jgi:hypothetical protein
LASTDVVIEIENYDFTNIEPFTIVIADWNSSLKFYELVWDGTKKHFKELPLEPKIWSSSTLYNTYMKEERLQWFETFKQENSLNAQSLLKFHKTTASNNKDYGVIMDRGFVKTTSITQVKKLNESIEIYSENLQNKTISNKIFLFPETVNE